MVDYVPITLLMVTSKKQEVGCMSKRLPNKHCQRKVTHLLLLSADQSTPIAQGLD